MQSAHDRTWVAAESGFYDVRKGVCRRQISVMVKRITLFRIICFCLLAACAASSQSEPALGERLRGLQHRSSDRQRQERGAWRVSPDAPLPDAPSALIGSRTAGSGPARLLTQTDGFRWNGVEPCLPPAVGAKNADRLEQGVFGPTQAESVAPVFPPTASLFYAAHDQASAKKDSAFFLDKYLYPPTLPHGSRYQASENDGLLGRATDAASRIFWTRDLTGTRRLNTSYLLRVVTSIAADTASRPYWRRSASGPFSDFGSTVGNDAGMNLFHEFGPDLGQAMTSHMPRFLARIEQRILQNVNQAPRTRPASSGPSR
jgi:hypothetical protein